MTTHLRLTRVFGPALSTNRKDVLSVKTALNRLGLFHDPEHGITPFPEPRMFESIKRFQCAQGLAVDGVMRRRGPTLEALNKVLVRNDVMRDIRPRTGPPPRAVAGGVGLKGPLMSNAAPDPDDVVKMKSALAHLGLFDDPEFGITPLPDRGLFEGIRKFQILRGLEPDGVVSRRGPTLAALNAELKAEGTRSDKRQTDGIQTKTAAGDRSGTVGPGGVNTGEDSGSGHRDQSQPLPVVDTGPPTTKPVNAAELFRKLGFDPKGLRDLEDIRGVEAPLTASRGRELANEAKKDAKQKTDEGNFSSSSLHDSDADAYRHALWNYLMTQKLGPDAAKRFGDAHEVTVPNPDSERLMDLFNNNVGRGLALDPKNKGRPAADVIMEALRSGQLQTRPFNLKP